MVIALAVAMLEGWVRLAKLVPADTDLELEPGRSAALSEIAPDDDLGRQIHPYLGWSRRPTTVDQELAEPAATPPTPSERRRPVINALGFESPIEDFAALAPDRFLVGIFGGSVASQLATIGNAALEDALEARFPELAGRVVVANFGSAGYKQPQQTIALLHALELGIRFDLVINVDGFNEVHLGARDARRGFHPIFPSRNHYTVTLALSGIAPTQGEIRLAAEAIAERERAAAIASRARTGMFSWSALARWISAYRARDALARAIEAEQELEELAASRSGGLRVAELSTSCPETDPRCGATIVDIWSRSSRIMRTLSNEIGARYVHVLQPNQYLPGTKPLNAEELRSAYREGELQANVVWGYPLLRDASVALEAAGIEFHDLTGAFAGRSETIYWDICCHYNELGNAIFARAIADAIEGELVVP